jgi:SAM-dependent methyltransferase
MVTVKKVSKPKLTHGQKTVFREMALAHKWCRGTGVELGAAAHNPFNLKAEVINVAPGNEADFAFYRDAQIGMCGAYAVVDKEGSASSIPVEDASLDFIIHSHVIEHEPNIVASFIEAHRALKEGGILFMIFPKRDALPKDRGRPLSTLDEMLDAYEQGWTFDTAPEPAGQGKGGHYWVLDLDTMMGLVNYLAEVSGFAFEIVDWEETDSKVGNGHTLVLQKVVYTVALPEAEESAPSSEPAPEPKKKSKKKNVPASPAATEG